MDDPNNLEVELDTIVNTFNNHDQGVLTWTNVKGTTVTATTLLVASIDAAITPATPGATATDVSNRIAQLISYLNSTTGATWPALPTKNLTQYLPLSGGTLTGNLAFDSATHGVAGITSGTTPAAGNIGEKVRSLVTTASGVTMTLANTPYNITSIALTAGIWDVSGMGVWAANTVNTGASNPYFDTWICTTSASYTGSVMGDNYGEAAIPSGLTPSVNVCISIPSFRVEVSGSTTYYLNAASGSSFAAGSPKASGRISATRVG